jgi:excisionase family DNA binding protein
MTLIEAAAILGVTAATLRQQIARGRIKARKVGRDWTVTAAEVKRYAETRKGRADVPD